VLSERRLNEVSETSTTPALRASRSLLFPGKQPPLSHFGATLLRHVVTTGLRYTAHQLGQPLPEKTPVTIVKLRVYLDRKKIEESFGTENGGWIARALLEPEGCEIAPVPSALRGSLLFHRTRLRIVRPPSKSRPTVVDTGSPTELWTLFTETLTQLLPRTNDAVLSEVIASLDRRRKREDGADLNSCQSPFAASFLAGRATRLDALGSPDLRSPSWSEVPQDPPSPEPTDLGRTHPLRGRFREWFRISLDRLRPIYLAYAESAAVRGIVDQGDDAFFFPFGLGHNLTGKRAPGWLAEAVASNRSEFDTVWSSPDPPPDRLLTGAPTLAKLGRAIDWSDAPLALLP